MTTIVSELFKYLIILLAVYSLPFPTCQVNYKASNYKASNYKGRNLLGDNAGYSLEFFFFFLMKQFGVFRHSQFSQL